MTHSPAAVLAELGIELPEVIDDPKYLNWRASVSSGLIHLSGHMPYIDGKLLAAGTVGANIDEATARESMRIATINALATATHAVGGLDNLRIVQMLAFIASTPDFGGHSNVADAGSELLVAVLGEHGRHARTAFGVAALPRTSPVEVQLIVEARA
ncbi:RidA family protein [Leucobacter rhizosphaerae]|uniref:RidA family protein n=1 Tax=Leucobacter rhizosphaerae TaxID=2932245 RepID=A0ABY4FSP6_9MICO|nr:RidA family protein [Leucobacter rhizosphaerae]UOQ59316.1 RidA family protein [Leucobacter rhizosphaerae]